MDIELYKEGLNNFIGKRGYFTIAANSLKIYFDNNRHNYIWIDPQFRLLDKNGKVITTANDCPLHTIDDYKIRHTEWCGLFSGIQQKKFITYGIRDQVFKLYFENKQSIEIPYSEEDNDPELSYKHWYIVYDNKRYGDSTK